MGGNLVTGLSHLLSLQAAGLLFVGLLVGMFMGVLPGLGVSLALSLMLPFLYHLGVVPAVALMLGTLAGSYYAASIPAILLNTPGAPESFPTTLDGFPMAQKGQAGRALAISATSTLTGGLIGCVILVALLQVAGQLINVFHPPEFAAIIILALVLIGGSGESRRVSKIVLSGVLGFMLSFVGSDPITGVERFTFSNTDLFSGISVVPFALGVFAMTQMAVMYGRKTAVAAEGSLGGTREFRRQVPGGVKETLHNHWFDVVRSAVVASLLGLVPGIGGFASNFISYSIGRQTSKYRRDFGKGSPAGIASAEASSLSKEVGSLIPAVALGIPSGLGMVIFIAGLSILGLQPGPTLIKTNPSLPYTMMWVMAIGGLVSCAVGLMLTPWLSRVTSIRGPVLLPVISALAVIGSFASVTNFLGVVEVALFAVVGLVMRKLNYSLAAITIGLVLGNTFADNVHLTMSIYGWSFFAKSPLADVFLLIAAVMLVLFVRRGRNDSSPSLRGAVVAFAKDGSTRDHPVLEPATSAVIAGVCIAYTVTALGYPSQAGRLPAIISSIGAATALYRLGRWGLALASLRRMRKELASLKSGIRAASANDTSDSSVSTVTCVGPGASGAGTEPRQSSEPPQLSKRLVNFREGAALLWIFVLVLAAYLLGFELGLCIGVAGYCLTSAGCQTVKSRFVLAVPVSALTFGIAYLFVTLFHLTFAGRIVNA
jgi:putative tricarboxylic transport membrane protein